ncbi:tetratricopeptide repeat protein [Candidatus Magnetaquicoccus inordinatus]|uniref:tetratricopeptide repeat protein n=1 Tax=Candidatus Magnetaquicoccus inordinatus TaxID=2496818 RepID=UPI00187D41BE|nr:tetratricopeptide repeat protein [Candidatus Magnetaquicoccus inordinatus]
MKRFEFSVMLFLAFFVLCQWAQAVDMAAIRTAAEQGNPQAQTTLGGLYHHGQGVGQSDTEAAKWYLLAAEQGHAGAQMIIGMLFLQGQGVEQDDAKARYWLRRSAAQGEMTAQRQLDLLGRNRE